MSMIWGTNILRVSPHEFQMMWTAKDVNGFDSIINVVFFEESKKYFKKQIPSLPSPTDFRTCLHVTNHRWNIHIILIQGSMKSPRFRTLPLEDAKSHTLEEKKDAHKH